MANEPITQRISADLRRQIQEGTLGPGALLPSETEVARDYNVSRQTARSALQALEHEGLVIVRPRRGRVVRSNQRLALAPVRIRAARPHRPGNLGRLGNRHREPGPRPDTPGPPGRADHAARSRRGRLNLDPRTDMCVVRRHVRYIDGNPAIISDDYFDEKIVQGTELAEPEDTTRENILGRSWLRAGLRR